MIYDRTFRLSASHYGPKQHALARKCEVEGSISWADFQKYNAMLHGHNFKVRVVLAYDETDNHEAGAARPVYGVWDQDIEAVVMQWADRNISMHPDFYEAEWTSSTERLAEVLAAKLMKGFPPNVSTVEVTVHETEDIAVKATRRYGDDR